MSHIKRLFKNHEYLSDKERAEYAALSDRIIDLRKRAAQLSKQRDALRMRAWRRKKESE